LEEIAPLSARLIVNPVSMQLKGDRIRDLTVRLKAILDEEKKK
jgi:ATP phosphoribosyltransferase